MGDPRHCMEESVEILDMGVRGLPDRSLPDEDHERSLEMRQ